MTPSVLALIGATIVFSSFLSGVFGMAGGMVLLGVLLNYFDVTTAMILFSIIQLFANGWRALQWRHYVRWPIFGWYVVGAVVSCVLLGLAGGLYVHLLPLNTEALYLDLTFLTLAMLVVGGASSLWGAVVGALAVSALDSFLAQAENGVRLPGFTLDLPGGTRLVVVGTLMALVLILRPSGLTGGREFSVPWRRA